MKTCRTCAHWRQQPYHGLRAIVADQVGECRGGPPSVDFKFPRSRASDYCAAHTDAEPVRFSMGKVVAEETKKEHTLFDAGTAGGSPSEVLAYGAAAPSTAQAARPASNQSKKRKLEAQ